MLSWGVLARLVDPHVRFSAVTVDADVEEEEENERAGLEPDTIVDGAIRSSSLGVCRGGYDMFLRSSEF